jgi:hypothetical protein
VNLDAIVELEPRSQVSLKGIVCEITEVTISDADPTPQIKVRVVDYLP